MNNLSVDLAEARRREQVLAAIEEAVTAYRELADRNPDANLASLARSPASKPTTCPPCTPSSPAYAATWTAVTAGLTQTRNSGPVEGAVNRIKSSMSAPAAPFIAGLRTGRGTAGR